MEKRNDDIAQSAREAAEASRIFDPTLEALRVQRHACLASGGETAAIYDKLREFAIEMLRGAALHGSLERIEPLQNLANDVRHTVASLI